MSKFIDLTGTKFNHLSVESRNFNYNQKSGRKEIFWNCICDCGNKVIVSGSNLKKGNTKSCGCYRKKNSSVIHKKYNKYDLKSKKYGIGYTIDGQKFYFDKEDFDKIKDICWHFDKKGSVVGLQDGKSIKLHRLILSPQFDEIVDHKNHKRFDNQKENLRICSSSENSMNRKIISTNTSGFSGITYSKHNQKWRARIGVENKRISLGCYENIEDAVKARIEAENRYFGEFSYSKSMKEGLNNEQEN